MTTFFYNSINQEKILQEVEFLNYLCGKLFEKTFFSKIGNSEKIKKIYEDFGRKNLCILIPIPVKRKLNFSEKCHLKNPQNILDFPNQFDSFVKVVKVEKATLKSLDEKISPYFNKDYVGNDRIYILNGDERLLQYKDVVLGASTQKIRYYDLKGGEKSFELFLNLLKKEMKRLTIIEKELKSLEFWFTIGTSAIKGEK